MKFVGKKYDTQFTSTKKKKKYFMHEMHKLAMDMTFTHMTSKKDIKNHVKIAVSEMYKECKQLEDMKVMGVLEPNRLPR